MIKFKDSLLCCKLSLSMNLNHCYSDYKEEERGGENLILNDSHKKQNILLDTILIFK